MPRLSKKTTIRRRLEQELKQGLDALKSAQKEIKDAARFGRLPKIPATEYRAMLKMERQFETYNPKSTKLTPARKRAILKHAEETKELQQRAVYARYSSPNAKKKVPKEFKKSYEGYKSARVGKRGVWMPKEARGKVRPIGEMELDRDTDTYAIKTKRVTKEGFLRDQTHYIASHDVLEKKREKFKGAFEKLNRNFDPKTQRIRFFIGTNKSRATFSSVEQMLAHIDEYDKTPAARASFLNSLVVEVVSKGRPEPRYVGPKNNRRRAKRDDTWTHVDGAWRVSNMHEINHDDYIAQQEEMGEDEDE